jgi:hypothetical protein
MWYTIFYVSVGRQVVVTLYKGDELIGTGFASIHRAGSWAAIGYVLNLLTAGMDDIKLGYILKNGRYTKTAEGETPAFIASPNADCLLVGEGDSLLTWEVM